MTVANYPWTKTELIRILNTPISVEGKRALRRRELAEALALYKTALKDVMDAGAVPGSADLDASLKEILKRLDTVAAALEQLLKAADRDEAEDRVAA